MFGFGAKGPKSGKGDLDDILARHSANLAAERKTPARSDPSPSAAKKRAGFGRRGVGLQGT